MNRNIRIQLVALLLLLAACRPVTEACLELLPVKAGEKYGYINSKGEYIINPQFDIATFFRGDLALVKSNNKYGYINKKGEFAINAIYNNATVFKEGIAWVVKPNEAPTTINTQGEVLFTLREADEVENFSNDLARVVIAGKHGYINRKGEIIIPPIYSHARMFSEGLAIVQESFSGGYGYIDTAGKLVINYQFSDAARFKNNRAVVSLSSSGYGAIDEQGKYAISPQFSYMVADGDKYIIRLQSGIEYGYCDAKGKIIINPQFEECAPFGKSKLAAVKINEKYGYIDERGKIAINPQFEYAFPFNDDYAFVIINKKIGSINQEGQYLINPQFSDVPKDAFEVLNIPVHDSYIAFHQVQSEFFDIAHIATRVQEIITDNSLNGLSYAANLNQIIGKYPNKEGKIKNVSHYQPLSEISLCRDAEMTIFMAGDFFNKVSDGWWDYNYVINNASVASSFRCIISLVGNGYLKEDILFPFLLKSFGMTDNGEKTQKVKRNNFYLTFNKETNAITVTIHTTSSQESLPNDEERLNDNY